MKVIDITRNKYGAPEPGPRRLFGVEVEVENAAASPTRAFLRNYKWMMGGDGSLRNNGREFISKPMYITQAYRSFAALCKEAHNLEYVANHRTGIHVHVDVRDLELAQVAGVVAAYAAFEPLMFTLVGMEREECIYCVPWYRAPDQSKVVRSLAEGHAAGLSDACKYSALYLSPLLSFGTIEFRAAPTWTTPGPMRRWLSAINRLVEWGKERTPAQVLAACNRDTNDAVRSVFGRIMDDVTDPEEVIDIADSLGTVEGMLPYTYKAAGWTVPDGPAADGPLWYHRAARGARRLQM